MQIRNGRVAGCRFVPATSSGGPITPTLIVLHDTAGRLDKGSSVAWFRSKKCTTSAHFVVERDGEIVQMVECTKKAFHAGASEWRGRKFCNSFSIGIEIVNPGKLDAGGRAWFGKATDAPIERQATLAHGDGYWLPYTPEQIGAVKGLCRAIIAAYPDCNEITTHWAISPGRKIDPCPLLPLDDIVAHALGEDNADESDRNSQVGPEPAAAGLSPLAPPASVIQTSTGVNAAHVGLGGSAGTGLSIAKAAKQANTDEGFDWLGFAITLAEDPMFWIGVGTVISVLVIWRERIKKLVLGV